LVRKSDSCRPIEPRLELADADLVAVQNASFNTQYGTTQGTLSFTEMYGYTQAGQPNAKMLQAIKD